MGRGRKAPNAGISPGGVRSDLTQNQKKSDRVLASGYRAGVTGSLPGTGKASGEKKMPRPLPPASGVLQSERGQRGLVPSAGTLKNGTFRTIIMAKLFISAVNSSALAIARDSIEVGINEAGTPVVRVAFARGKGTGSQEIPVSDIPAVIDALSGYAENGINKSAKVFSPVDMLHATIGLNEDDRIQFRVSSGKGAKPTNLATEELPGIVAFLREVLPTVQAAAKKIK